LPKVGKPGTRPIDIGTVPDRLVAKTLDVVLSRIWNERFLPQSYGFRAGRSSEQMLAALDNAVYSGDTLVLAIDDIRRAFENVRIADVIAAHERMFREGGFRGFEPLLRLIRAALGGDQREVGIPQGHAFAPSALNAVLHFHHDLPLTNLADAPRFLRYADNVLYVCRSVVEGQQLLKEVGEQYLRPVGLELKGEDGVIDLAAGGKAAILGFVLTWSQGTLEYSVSDHLWAHLREALKRLDQYRDPALAAKQIILGWVAATARGHADANVLVRRLHRLARDCGFREAVSRKTIVAAWQRGRERADLYLWQESLIPDQP
jgi:hypothetical protein